MLPRRPLSARLVAIGAAAAVIGLTGAALAAGPKEAQARKALKLALEDDYLQTHFDAAENRLRAAIQSCGTSGCAPQLRAELHAALGAVLAGGKKELEDARDEFVEALQLDPNVKPNPDVLSTEVSFAFEQAKKKVKGGPAAPAEPKDEPADEAPAKKPADEPPAKKKPKPKEPEPPKDEPEPRPDAKDGKVDRSAKDDKDAKDPEAPPPPARKNWITLTFAPDISIVSGTNVCTADSQNTQHYICFRSDKSRYQGTPTKDNGDNINTGVGLSTLRVMLGYDRVLADNFTLGARVGFAFNGGSGDGASFLPVHAEGRFGYWPGKTPFVGAGVRPYFMVSGGVAQIDTKVDVQVLEDGRVCGAANPSSTQSMCTKPSPDGHTEDRVQTLAVYRQAGLGFGSVTFGMHFAPTAAVALYLAVRGSVTFPVVTGVLSPEGGLSLGF